MGEQGGWQELLGMAGGDGGARSVGRCRRWRVDRGFGELGLAVRNVGLGAGLLPIGLVGCEIGPCEREARFWVLV